jgi:hypothetical protein
MDDASEKANAEGAATATPSALLYTEAFLSCHPHTITPEMITRGLEGR